MSRILMLILLLMIGFESFCQSCCGELINKVYTNIIRFDSVYSEAQPNYLAENVSLTARITDSPDNTCNKRPLIILIHGGGFSLGTPSLMDSIATEFTRRGYLTASIQYRLGYKGSSISCPMDTIELIRAWYRASQDAKSAIRWFKEYHETFRIDTNLVFAGGWSAGGYALTGLAWMNEEYEKPIQTGQLNDTLISNQLYVRPDLGSVNGLTNLNGSSSKVKGIFSFASSFLFPEHLDEYDQTPLLYFNNKVDEIGIPWQNCDEDAWIYSCPTGLPKSCGIESMINLFLQYNVQYQYTLFETTMCSHYLHDPCFPMFQTEVEEISLFLNSLSECQTANGYDNNNIDYQASTLIISEDDFAFFKFKYSSLLLINNIGTSFSLNNLEKNQLIKGFYYCKSASNSLKPFRVFIQ